MPRIEELRDACFRARTRRAAGHLPRHPARSDARSALLSNGQYLQPAAYRSNLTGILEGFATFWNVRRG